LKTQEYVIHTQVEPAASTYSANFTYLATRWLLQLTSCSLTRLNNIIFKHEVLNIDLVNRFWLLRAVAVGSSPQRRVFYEGYLNS